MEFNPELATDWNEDDVLAAAQAWMDMYLHGCTISEMYAFNRPWLRVEVYPKVEFIENICLKYNIGRQGFEQFTVTDITMGNPRDLPLGHRELGLFTLVSPEYNRFQK